MTTIAPPPAAKKPAAQPFDSLGIFLGRKGQRHALAGTPIVSSDNHICLGGEDFWFENAPPHLKDRVPRVWFDPKNDFWVTGLNGKSLYAWGSDDLVKSMEAHEGAWNVDRRVADMDAEGIDKEVAFPQVIPSLFSLKDFEAREYIFREYNRYLARQQRRQPGRFYGVAVGPYWAPAKAAEFIEEMKADGIKVLMLALNPGVFPDGQKIHYASDEMRPLWDAIVAADLPVCFHIGENTGFEAKGALGTNVLHNVGGPGFRAMFGQLMFGGVFDNYPTLRVAFVEANLHWIPGMLQDAAMIQESFRPLLDYTPRLRAQEYWDRHCYATFMYDPMGLKNLDRIGIDKVMWSTDYPHNESTFGYSGSAVQWIIDTVGEAAAIKIVGGNAMKFFRF
jgi:predicted TIM-barrel fold metal-dependent hydrolase